MTDAREEAKRRTREMAEERGYTLPVFDWLAEHDPEYELSRLNFTRELFTPHGDVALPVKYRELIVAVVLAFRQIPSTKLHLKRALEEGASLQELIEAFEVAGLPGGLPTMSFGMKALMELDQEGVAAT